MKPYILCSANVIDPKTGNLLFTQHRCYDLRIVQAVCRPLKVRVVPGKLIFAPDLRQAIETAGKLLGT